MDSNALPMTKRLPRATKCPSFYWYWPNTCVRLSNVLDDSGLMVQRTCDFSIICFLARLQIMERGLLFFSAVGKLIWNRQIAWNSIPLSAFRIPKKDLEVRTVCLPSNQEFRMDKTYPFIFLKGGTFLWDFLFVWKPTSKSFSLRILLAAEN